MTRLISALACLSVVSFSACGAGTNNVSACKSLVSKLKCGSTPAPISESACDAYKDTTCDISEYFTCMEGAYVCKDGNYDPSKAATASNCISKATCN